MASPSPIDPSAYPSDSPRVETTLLKRENDELRAQVANLQTERAQLLRIASSAISHLQRHQSVIEPEGMWILKEEEGALQSILQLTESRKANRGVWRWAEISPLKDSFPDLPNFTIKKQAESYSGFRPFLHSFPLEIFELIVSLADKQTVARTCRASMACLQLFSPGLYRFIEATSSDTLRWAFCKRSPSSSSRLTSSLSLNHIRVLEFASTTCLLHLHPGDVSLARLDGLPQLERLSIVMDIDPFEQDEDDEEDDLGVLRNLSLCPPLLSALNPTELVVKLTKDPWKVLWDEPVYRLSSDTASAISGWSRLRTIRLEALDLVWEDEDMEIGNPRHGLCFLGAGGSPIVSTDVSIVWDLTEWGPGGLPSFWWSDIVQLLVERDRTLFHPSITSAVILVETKDQVNRIQTIISEYPFVETKDQVNRIQTIISEYPEEVPTCLKVVQKQPSSS